MPAIALVRSLRGRTQRDLARALGRDRTQVSRYESGESPVAPEILHKIATFLHVPLWLLLSDPAVLERWLDDALDHPETLPLEKCPSAFDPSTTENCTAGAGTGAV